jgi:hypothetical protein
MRIQYAFRGLPDRHFVDLPAHPVSVRDVLSLPGESQTPVAIVSHPVRHASRCWSLAARRVARYYVELAASFEQYLQRVNRKRRTELRTKNAKGRGGWCGVFREYRSSDEMSAFCDLTLLVSRQSFQKRLGRGLSELCWCSHTVSRP